MVPLVLRLTTYDAYNLEGPDHGAALPIVLNGALLLQALWRFKPSVNDVLASRYVRRMVCDARATGEGADFCV